MFHSARNRTLLAGTVVVLTLGLSVSPAFGQPSELSSETPRIEVLDWAWSLLARIWDGNSGHQAGAAATGKVGGMMDPDGDDVPEMRTVGVQEALEQTGSPVRSDSVAGGPRP